MSLLNNSNAIPTAVGGGYNLENSLRLRSSASAYLSRTPATAGNRKTFTISLWVKRGILGTNNAISLLEAWNGASSDYFAVGFTASDNFRMYNLVSNSYTLHIASNATYRDPSSWYHIVVAVDTTQATSTNRVKVYINGEQVTSLSTTVYPSLNADMWVNNNILHKIARNDDYAGNFDGYLTEVNLIDGQQLTASDFGDYNSDTGVWQPIEYTGTYGTNGFYLKGRGTDNSSNGNNWTENNFNTTNSALTTYDIMTDVPTLTDEDTANYAVFNPLGTNDISTFSEANLKVTTGSGASTTGTTIAMSSGKWYAEFVCTAKTSVNMYIGLVEASTFDGDNQGDEGTNNGYIYSNAGNIYHGGANDAYGASWTVGDVMAIAFDADTRNVTFYKNNVSQGVYTRIASENTGGDWLMVVSEGQGAATATFVANFGQRPFAYTPPAGYLKLNTFNLPDSSIVDGSEHFGVGLWTGNGSASGPSVTNLNFKPEFLWSKSRSNAYNHYVYDTVRSPSDSPTAFLGTNSTYFEQYFNAFTLTDTGFNLATTNVYFNQASATYVAWALKAGGTAVSNTDGTITSTVSANTTAGFSVVTYTGNGGTGTVGHGLGSAPEMIIIKNRSQADGWYVWHQNNGAGIFGYLFLNSTDQVRSSTPQFGSTAPDSSVISLTRNTYDWANASGENYVAYCFAEVEGYSKISSYVGNGSTDGPFIYTGFRPAWIMFRSTILCNWVIVDSARSTFNVMDDSLYPNTSGSEITTITDVDFLSNGFKWRGTLANETNVNGQTYIYMAFASNPFKNSLAR